MQKPLAALMLIIVQSQCFAQNHDSWEFDVYEGFETSMAVATIWSEDNVVFQFGKRKNADESAFRVVVNFENDFVNIGEWELQFKIDNGPIVTRQAGANDTQGKTAYFISNFDASNMSDLQFLDTIKYGEVMWVRITNNYTLEVDAKFVLTNADIAIEQVQDFRE